jgi:hypothetical protein
MGASFSSVVLANAKGSVIDRQPGLGPRRRRASLAEPQIEPLVPAQVNHRQEPLQHGPQAGPLPPPPDRGSDLRVAELVSSPAGAP